MRRAARRSRHWWWVVALGITVVAGILGYIGFGRQLPRLSFFDRLYYSLGLFRFTTGVPPPYNSASLEVARWLAPTATAYVGINGVAALFTEQWTRFKARRLSRNHVVVCGLGRCGSRLAISFHDEGTPAVVIDRSAKGADTQECRDRGIPVLLGDATDPSVLRLSGLVRARYLVVVCGDDGTNTEVALLAQTLAAGRRKPIRCLVHISDEQLCRLLEEAALQEPSRAMVRFEFFNVFGAGPRALLDEYADVVSDRDGIPPHLIVVGSGHLGLNLVAEACRRWRLERAEKTSRMRVTLVSPHALALHQALAVRYPSLAGTCDVSTCEVDPDDPDDGPLAIPLGDSAGGGAARGSAGNRPGPESDGSGSAGDGAGDYARTTAFVCMDEDAAGLRATIRLRRSLPPQVKVVVCTSGRSGVAGLFSGAVPDVLPNVEGFELLDRVCRPEILLNGLTESLAQAIHADYVRRRREKEPNAARDDPALRSWDKLPETLRDANRDQAADVGRKLATVGCQLAPTSDWDSESFRFAPQEVELLGRMEHDRWQEERIRDGYRLGPVRDPVRKLSPYLVPWEQLSEDVRDLDREAVGALPGFLARAGYSVVRR
ncbi:MAG TPA: NAD-binding protein [Acidimicrobiales bacterium]|nr:NAD-binding protein [Acidimicrobiales bacterium]